MNGDYIGRFIRRRPFTFWAASDLRPGVAHTFLEAESGYPGRPFRISLTGYRPWRLIMMMMAGTIAARLGCRRSLTIAGLCIAAFLNLLCYMPVYGLAVFTAVCLGASLGLMDVVVNINGIFIERKVKTRIMSGLQAMWSLGNFMGAAFFAFLLQFQLPWRGVALPVPPSSSPASYFLRRTYIMNARRLKGGRTSSGRKGKSPSSVLSA